jgi:hypothetical protein
VRQFNGASSAASARIGRPRNGYSRRLADVAQLVEHFTRNEGVPGSSPGVGSRDLQGKSAWLAFSGRRSLGTHPCKFVFQGASVKNLILQAVFLPAGPERLLAVHEGLLHSRATPPSRRRQGRVPRRASRSAPAALRALHSAPTRAVRISSRHTALGACQAVPEVRALQAVAAAYGATLRRRDDDRKPLVVTVAICFVPVDIASLSRACSTASAVPSSAGRNATALLRHAPPRLRLDLLARRQLGRPLRPPFADDLARYLAAGGEGWPLRLCWRWDRDGHELLASAGSNSFGPAALPCDDLVSVATPGERGSEEAQAASHFRPLTQANAEAIALWHYPEPFSFYDWAEDPDDLAELLDLALRGDAYFAGRG